MALALGTKLGPYEIVAPLGAGGMGEVYRARDTKLNRDVALKVLPEAFAQDAERMARFRREAQVLASLNHPNIATIYGLEESNGNCALVMELVEGPTLAERIAGTQPLTRPAAGGPPSPLARGESKKQGEMPADGSGAAEPLTTGENALFPGSWSPDGQALVFTQADPTDWLGHLDARAPGRPQATALPANAVQ